MKHKSLRVMATLLSVTLSLQLVLPAFALELNSNNTASASTQVVGVVDSVSTLDVVAPLDLKFFIRADRTLDTEAAYIESNTASPLDVKIIEVEKIVKDEYIVAPDLVSEADAATIDWNNLTVTKTRNNIHIQLNDVDLALAGGDTYIGNIRSAYGEDDEGNFVADPKYLKMELTQVKYGKAWDNLEEETFGYIVGLEFSLYDGTHELGPDWKPGDADDSEDVDSDAWAFLTFEMTEDMEVEPEDGYTIYGPVNDDTLDSTSGSGSGSDSFKEVTDKLTETEKDSNGNYILSSGGTYVIVGTGSGSINLGGVVSSIQGGNGISGGNSSSGGDDSDISGGGSSGIVSDGNGSYTLSTSSGSNGSVGTMTDYTDSETGDEMTKILIDLGDNQIAVYFKSEDKSSEGNWFKVGSDITVEAIAGENYEFVAWYVDGSKATTNEKYSLTVESDTTFTASFKAVSAEEDNTSNVTTLAAGLYDDEDNLIADWDTLTTTYGLDTETDYTVTTYSKSTSGSGYTVLQNEDLADGVKLVVGGDVSDYAFYNCDTLKEVIIPGSVTSIGGLAFTYSDNLESVTIANTVTNIDSNAFKDCTSLSSVTLEEGLTLVGANMFYGCTALTSVDLPDSLTTISTGAFNGSGLTSVDIPGSVAEISNTAFSNCESLASVTLNEGTTTIGSQAFNNCSALTSIEMPSTITSIGEYAFKNCTSLATVELNDGLTTIGYDAFYKCTSLESIELPGTITTIRSSGSDSTNNNSGAFYGCTNLKTVILNEGMTTVGTYTFMKCTAIESITIPSTVTNIGAYVFYGCTGITSLTISEGVEQISTYAFYGCTGLTSVTIPSTVTKIGTYVFSGCTNLTEVIINNTEGNVDIGSNAIPDNATVTYTG